jgi:excisionase family DNA binding protein
MEGWMTIPEAARPENLGKSNVWILGLIRSGRVRFTKAGRFFLIPVDEVARIKKDPPRLSYEDLFGRPRGEATVKKLNMEEGNVE